MCLQVPLHWCSLLLGCAAGSFDEPSFLVDLQLHHHWFGLARCCWLLLLLLLLLAMGGARKLTPLPALVASRAAPAVAVATGAIAAASIFVCASVERRQVN